ncbi:MAG: SprT family zinc-dependent metalloprotease [Nitrososphaeraceae archaeon]|nr:SprT family zinc-dependent metalloprotease [Nitrososphaeraceae archaeon]
MLIPFLISGKENIFLKKRTSNRASQISLIANIHGFFITVPKKIPDYYLTKFLDENRIWISKNYYKYKKNNFEYAKTYEEKYLLFTGKKFYLNIIKSYNETVIFSESLKKITFHVNSKRNYKIIIKNWYREQTNKIINERLPELNKKMKVNYNRVRVKDNSTVWGSCSSKNNLNFSLYLSAFPIEIIDYILIHELAHIREFNHSANFWEIVKKYDPQYKNHIEYIRRHGNYVRI